MDYNSLKLNAEAAIHAADTVHPEPEYIGMTAKILQLYKDVLDKSTGDAERGIESFHFADMIRKSPFNSKSKRANKLLELQSNIFHLAYEWDTWVYDKRREQFPDQPNLPRGEHLFFLTYQQKPTHKTFYVKTFNSHLPPDQRLVAIAIPEKRPRLNHMPVLHEMGHVIGCRKRSERQKYLFEFVLLYILCEIFKECITEYSGLTPGKPIEIPVIRRPEQYNYYERNWWNYSENICQNLQIIYNRLSQKVGPSLNRPDWVISYADEYVSLKRDHIVDILNHRDFWYDCLPEDAAGRLWNAYERLTSREKTPFLTVCDNVIDIFEEPAADCFMIKIGGLSLRKYIKMVMEEAWDTWTETRRTVSEESFLAYMASDITRYRVLAICFAMIQDRPAEKAALYLKNPLAYFSAKGRNINRAKKMFSDMYRMQTMADHEDFLQKLLNPQQILSEYIQLVFHHDHFKEIRRIPTRTYVKKIRKLIKHI